MTAAAGRVQSGGRWARVVRQLIQVRYRSVLPQSVKGGLCDRRDGPDSVLEAVGTSRIERHDNMTASAGRVQSSGRWAGGRKTSKARSEQRRPYSLKRRKSCFMLRRQARFSPDDGGPAAEKVVTRRRPSLRPNKRTRSKNKITERITVTSERQSLSFKNR